jgi:hypothetical protein
VTPDEIKQRMVELDAELASKLRGMGFSDAEVHRVLDSDLPAAQRDTEIKDILAREFMREAARPGSPIMDEVIRRVEHQLPQIEAELVAKRTRRRRLAVGVVVGAVAIGVAIYLAA